MGKSLARGMDLIKFLQLAKDLGCTIRPPGGGDNHYRVNHLQQPGRELALKPNRKDTPWVAFQWLRRVESAQKQLTSPVRAAAVFEASATAITEDPAGNDQVVSVTPAPPPPAPPPTVDEIVLMLREAKAEVVDAKQRTAQADSDLRDAEQLVADAKAARLAAEQDQTDAAKLVPALLGDLEAALEREEAAPGEHGPRQRAGS